MFHLLGLYVLMSVMADYWGSDRCVLVQAECEKVRMRKKFALPPITNQEDIRLLGLRVCFWIQNTRGPG